MRKIKLELEGKAYRQGDTVEVYLKLPNGKYVKCTGDRSKAQRGFGRDTRETSSST